MVFQSDTGEFQKKNFLSSYEDTKCEFNIAKTYCNIPEF